MGYKAASVVFIILLKSVVLEATFQDISGSCVNGSRVLWDSLDVWNPVELLQRWKTYSGNNIPELCARDIGEYLEAFYNGSAWAIKMVDATGRYNGGLFWGNEYWMGSNSLCYQLDMSRFNRQTMEKTHIENQHYRRTAERRLVTDDEDPLAIFAVPPFPVTFFVAHLSLNTSEICQLANVVESVANIGLCLPRSCGAPEVRTALEWAVKGPVRINKVRIVQDRYSFWNDTRFYILSPIFFVVSVLIVIGTALEYFTDDEDKCKTTIWFQIFIAFSLISNTKSICSFDVGQDTLAPIHGLKFLSMAWVILIHTCLMLFNVAVNKRYRDRAEGDLLYQTLSNGTFSVDTFFTLSGVLVSFLFFRTTSKFPVKKLIGIGGFIGNTLLYISMMAYRLIRLSPPYLIVIVMAGLFTQRRLQIAPLTLPDNDNTNCERFWWRNAIFVNTFYPSKEMCMGWSWYLSNDTQFYVLGVPLLLVALRYRVVSLFLGILCLLSAWITTGYMSIKSKHTLDVRDPLAHYDELYDKPWTRVGPYLVGMATGYFLFRTNCQLSIPRPVAIFVWGVSLSTMATIMYGVPYIPSGPIPVAIYTAFSHTMWSVAVAWVLIGCVTGNGWLINDLLSLKYMYPLSRVSYCAYLIHPVVMREVLLSSEIPFYISVELMMCLFLGLLVLSMGFAAILSLAFEAPMVALIRLGNPMRRNAEVKK